MASLLVNRGLQVIVGRASNTADSFTEIIAGSVDDNATGFTATDTALDSVGTVTNSAAVAFDATPTRSAQTTTHVFTFGTGVANFTHKRVALHNLASGSVTASSTSLVGGTDGLTFAKTSAFVVEYSVTIALTDNS